MSKIVDPDLEKVLLDLQVIPREQLEEAYELAQEENKPFGKILLAKGLISDEELTKVVAEMISIPYVALSNEAIDDQVLHIIPEIYARKNSVISFRKDKEGLHIAVKNPEFSQIISFLTKKTGIPVIPYLTTDKEIEDTLFLYSKDAGGIFDEIIEKNLVNTRDKKLVEPSIIKIVDTIIYYA